MLEVHMCGTQRLDAASGAGLISRAKMPGADDADTVLQGMIRLSEVCGVRMYLRTRQGEMSMLVMTGTGVQVMGVFQVVHMITA